MIEVALVPAQCLRRRARREAIGERRQPVGLLHGKAKHARGVAHGAASAVGDLLADHRGVIPAVLLVHVLNDVLALFVREVDVDVGRFLTILAQETLEEQVELHRIDRRNAETETDRGVRGGAASLAENAATSREAHDIPDDEKKAGEPELANELQLMRELACVRLVACPAPAFVGALGDETLQVLVGRYVGWKRERRQRRSELLHAELTAFRDRERVANAFGRVLPSPHHLRSALEIPLSVGAEARSHLVERALLLEAGKHVVDDPIARGRVVYVVGHDPGNVQCARDLDESLRRFALFGQAMVPTFHGNAAVEDVEQQRGRFARRVHVAGGRERGDPAARTSRERKQPVGVACERVEIDARLATRVVHAPERDERGEIAVAGPILGEKNDVMRRVLGRPPAGCACGAVLGRASGADVLFFLGPRKIRRASAGREPHPRRSRGRGLHVRRSRGRGLHVRRSRGRGLHVRRSRGRERNLRPDDRLHLKLSTGLRESHRSAQLIVIGEREGAVSQVCGTCDEQLGKRATVEQRERGVAMQLDVLRCRGARALPRAGSDARCPVVSHTILAPTIRWRHGTARAHRTLRRSRSASSRDCSRRSTNRRRVARDQ